MSDRANIASLQHALIDLVAELSGIDRAEIRLESRLVRDLEMDSLAIAELVVACVERFEMEGLVVTAEHRDWDQLAVRDLVHVADTASPATP